MLWVLATQLVICSCSSDANQQSAKDRRSKSVYDRMSGMGPVQDPLQAPKAPGDAARSQKFKRWQENHNDFFRRTLFRVFTASAPRGSSMRACRTEALRFIETYVDLLLERNPNAKEDEILSTIVKHAEAKFNSIYALKEHKSKITKYLNDWVETKPQIGGKPPAVAPPQVPPPSAPQRARTELPQPDSVGGQKYPEAQKKKANAHAVEPIDFNKTKSVTQCLLHLYSKHEMVIAGYPAKELVSDFMEGICKALCEKYYDSGITKDFDRKERYEFARKWVENALCLKAYDNIDNLRQDVTREIQNGGHPDPLFSACGQQYR